MKISCTHCGNQYEVEDRYMGQTLKCPDCGNEITINNPKLAPCPDCLTLISKRARTCPHCGAPLIEPEKNEIRSTANFVIHEDLSEEKEIMVCHPSAMNYLGGNSARPSDLHGSDRIPDPALYLDRHPFYELPDHNPANHRPTGMDRQIPE